MNNKFKKIILLLGDIFVLYLSLYLTLIIRYQQNPQGELLGIHLLPFSLTFIAWVLIFYIFGLYDLNLAVNDNRFFKKIAASFTTATLISVLFFYLTPLTKITPKTNLVIFIVIFAFLIVLWRRLYNRSLKSYLPKTNIAIIGKNRQVVEIINELKQKPHLGFNISFILDPDESEKEIRGVPIFDNINRLCDLIKDKNINSIILATSPGDSIRLRSVLFDCLHLKVNYINLTNFYETITGKVPTKAINQMWFLENLSEGNKGGFDLFKRVCDLTLGCLALIIVSPFWPIIALLIKTSSKGKVFYTQIRIGQSGKSFKIIKFRTMREDGNHHLPTTEEDERVTSLGNILRKSRIDELPQLINIIKGEMSFVGPRPERPELIVTLERQIPFYKERMLVKPGVTGWDQISGEYHSPSYEDTMKKLQYDLFYIKNRSIYLDLSIALKTIYTVLSRAGR